MIINLTILETRILLAARDYLPDDEIEKFGAENVAKVFDRIKAAKDAAVFKRKRIVNL